MVRFSWVQYDTLRLYNSFAQSSKLTMFAIQLALLRSKRLFSSLDEKKLSGFLAKVSIPNDLLYEKPENKSE